MKYLKIGTRAELFAYFRDNMLTGVGFATDEGKPVYYNYIPGCLEFRPHTAGETCTVQIDFSGLQKNVGNGWESYTQNETLTFTSPIYLRGTSQYGITINKSFVMTGDIDCNGNILALGDYHTEFPAVRQYAFAVLFKNCTSLIKAPDCDARNFEGYQSIFQQTFYGCTNLEVAPAILPATTLTTSCYNGMFQGCTSLKVAPALPATSLANNCYQNMFNGCTGLKVAPVLPATTLVERCYSTMFYLCSNIKTIKIHATDISASYCLSSWLESASAKGVIACPSSTSFPSGVSGIPSGWKQADL